ncbi:hypothetical protein [Methylocystis sp.]|uniref:hypothetical protein n=1 Tax=Methylocystis sp. TaxID=1911079 RepID=UPI003D0F2F1D
MTEDELKVEALRLAISSFDKGTGVEFIVAAAKEFHDFLLSDRPDFGRQEDIRHTGQEQRRDHGCSLHR